MPQALTSAARGSSKSELLVSNRICHSSEASVSSKAQRIRAGAASHRRPTASRRSLSSHGSCVQSRPSVLSFTDPHPSISASIYCPAKHTARSATAGSRRVRATQAVPLAPCLRPGPAPFGPSTRSPSGRRGGHCKPSRAWRHEAREQLRQLLGGACARHRGQAAGQGHSFARRSNAPASRRRSAALALNGKAQRCFSW